VLPNSFATKEARADRVVDLAVSGLVRGRLARDPLNSGTIPGGQTDFAFTAYPNCSIPWGWPRGCLSQFFAT